jgi:hypothetical protein
MRDHTIPADNPQSIFRDDILTLLQSGKSTEAEVLCLRFLENSPQDIETLYFLAHSLKLQYRYKDALQTLRRAVELTSSKEVLTFLIEMLYRVGHTDEAGSLIKNLRKEFPSDIALAELYGKIIGRAESGVGCRLELKDLNSQIPSNSSLSIQKDQDFIPIYSAKGEQRLIDNFFNSLANHSQFVVDIGAGDGFNFSNSLELIKSKQWQGLLIEPDITKAKSLTEIYSFINIQPSIVIDYITPPRVIDMFRAFEVPKNFGFLSLDVDSIEYPLLQVILANYRPSLICLEINERVKPGIEYYTKFHSETQLPYAPLLLGVSITSAYNLLNAFDYCSFHLEYNNLFATPREFIKNFSFTDHNFNLSDIEIYEMGYTNRGDSSTIFPWNQSFIKLHELNNNDFCQEWSNLIKGRLSFENYFLSFSR